MITLRLAQELKQAGLVWHPKDGDCFAIPERGIDDRRFYVTTMAIRVEMLHGHPTIMFQGAYEWALDYIFLSEVVWMPNEGQLRESVEARLPSSTGSALRLTRTSGGYKCDIAGRGAYTTFSAQNAVSAYGQALLHLLTSPEPPIHERML
jgi:hypothetical protein